MMHNYREKQIHCPPDAARRECQGCEILEKCRADLHHMNVRARAMIKHPRPIITEVSRSLSLEQIKPGKLSRLRSIIEAESKQEAMYSEKSIIRIKLNPFRPGANQSDLVGS